jgi:hypothetical protein
MPGDMLDFHVELSCRLTVVVQRVFFEECARPDEALQAAGSAERPTFTASNAQFVALCDENVLLRLARYAPRAHTVL